MRSRRRARPSRGRSAGRTASGRRATRWSRPRGGSQRRSTCRCPPTSSAATATRSAPPARPGTAGLVGINFEDSTRAGLVLARRADGGDRRDPRGRAGARRQRPRRRVPAHRRRRRRGGRACERLPRRRCRLRLPDPLPARLDPRARAAHRRADQRDRRRRVCPGPPSCRSSASPGSTWGGGLAPSPTTPPCARSSDALSLGAVDHARAAAARDVAERPAGQDEQPVLERRRDR